MGRSRYRYTGARYRGGRGLVLGVVALAAGAACFFLLPKFFPAQQEIQAVYDAGYTDWLLWNAGNTYTADGLLPADS